VLLPQDVAVANFATLVASASLILSLKGPFTNGFAVSPLVYGGHLLAHRNRIELKNLRIALRGLGSLKSGLVITATADQ
jgi:hypothetical protein